MINEWCGMLFKSVLSDKEREMLVGASPWERLYNNSVGVGVRAQFDKLCRNEDGDSKSATRARQLSPNCGGLYWSYRREYAPGNRYSQRVWRDRIQHVVWRSNQFNFAAEQQLLHDVVRCERCLSFLHLR